MEREETIRDTIESLDAMPTGDDIRNVLLAMVTDYEKRISNIRQAMIRADFNEGIGQP